MKTDDYRSGVPYWAQLSTTDPAAAAAFYEAMFGWHLPSAGRTGVCELGGVAASVIEIAAADEPSKWTTYLYAEDLEAALDHVVATGGTQVQAPRASASGYRVAQFADPSGAVIGLFARGSSGATLVNEPGALIWGELITDDGQASAEFYRDAFGWDLSEPSGPLNRREWLLDGRPIAGLLPRPAAMPAEMPVYWDTYFGTADPDAATKLAATLGATVLMGPTDVEIGRISVFADPTGAAFSVLAPPTTTSGE
jgi:predicted enzyme related to lactoylglutathione lyase